MATIEQVKALMRAHFESNNDKFKTIVLQIAAHEAKIGHTSSAREIKEIVQNPKYLTKNKIVQLNNKLDVLELKNVEHRLKDLVLADEIEEKISRILKEYRKVNVLRKNGLKNRSKILLSGQPGTGKTMTAAVISRELNLPLFVVQIDKLITKFMGETSVKLRQVFEQINDIRGVYLFDEFDAIGSDRSLDNDVGEMRRILNSFLQHLEEDHSYSIIIAATNNPKLLDNALFRRFDDVLEYNLPDTKQIKKLFELRLSEIASTRIFNNEVYEKVEGLNHADIAKVCEDLVKYSILEEKSVTTEILLSYIKDRKEIYKIKEA